MKRWAGWAALALVIGLALGLVKGDGDVTRGAIGNLSAPWLLLPLWAAWRAGSSRLGAIVGLAVTLVGLVGFYCGMFVYVHDHLGLSTGLLHRWVFVVEANKVWFLAGLVSGPAVGAVAGFLGERARGFWLGILSGFLLLLEMPVVEAIQGVRLPVVNIAWAAGSQLVYGVEAALGAVLIAIVVARRPKPARPSSA